MNFNKVFLSLVISVLTGQLLFAGTGDKAGAVYGTPLTQERIIPLAKVLTNPQNYTTSDFLTEGQVDKVCSKKGCWMEVKSGSSNVRVTFKDYGFFVPKEILSKTVMLQGKMVAKTLSVKEQKHYLKDADAAQHEIDAVSQPKSVYEFVAVTVQEK